MNHHRSSGDALAAAACLLLLALAGFGGRCGGLVVAAAAAAAGHAHRRGVDRARHRAAASGPTLGARPACRRRRGCSTSGSAGRARRARSAPAATRSSPASRRASCSTRWCAATRSLESVRFVEGWTFAQMRAALARAPSLKPATRGLSDAQLMAALGEPGAVAGRALLSRHLRLQPRRQRPDGAAAGPRARCSGGWSAPGPSGPPTCR